MNIRRFILYLTITFTGASALNILGIFPYEGKSHFLVYEVYLEELARRGHNVTVISYFPKTNPPPNYKDIVLPSKNNELIAIPFDISYKAIIDVGLYLTSKGRENCDNLVANKEVQNMIRNGAKFDVVVVENFNTECALGIAYMLKAPVVGIMSFVFMPWHYNRFGVPNNPSYVPNHFLGGGTKPTLYQRIERTILNFASNNLYYWLTQRGDQNALAKYYDNVPPLEALARDIKVVLVGHHFILTGSRLFPANVIEVGGYHIKAAKNLTGELKNFVVEAEHGVIFISFGTTVDMTTLTKDQEESLLGTILELPQRFIMKSNNKAMKSIKNKLYVSDWLPQIDILGHPKTLAFLSHAGMGGVTEAIHFGVPVVAIPLIGDQPSNAAAVEESGMGVQLSVKDLSKDNLLAAFRTVLNPEFRNNVKLISKAWHDRPISPMDSAIFWTEYVAKYPNITYRTAAADVPLYQYWNLDLLFIFSIFLILPLFVFMKCLSCCCRDKASKSVIRKNIKSKKRN